MLKYDNIFPDVKTLINAAYFDIHETTSLIQIGVFRQSLIFTALFFKLNSCFNCSIAIDAFALDAIAHEYRFTVVYNIQSYLNNNTIRLITKTSSSLALTSLQNIFAAFN